MKKNLFGMFIINSIIAVVIGLISGTLDQWHTRFLSAFIFSQAIGFAIYLLIHMLSPVLERLSKLMRSVSLVGVFLAGGVLGMRAGALIFELAFDVEVGLESSSVLQTLALAIVFGSLGYFYFGMKEDAEEMATALKEKELQKEKLEHLATKAELEALQSKINPHFLFNALNSIASLIPEEPAVAESTIEKLSEVFRSTLLSSQKEVIKLSDELKIVRDYVAIEQLRLGDRLRFEIDCDPAVAEEMRIPGLTIQPLVENSIRHGISPKPTGGRITVGITRNGQQCLVQVKDDGVGFIPTLGGNGHGLSNVRDRLRLLYGERSGFEIRHENGTQILITLPINPD